MSDSFQLFRLSLLVRRDRSLFAAWPEPTRAEYLRQVFGEEHRFDHYKTPFHYIPDPTHSTDDALLGRVGRPFTSDENTPPDEGLEEISHAGWKASVLVVDPGDHEDGQKASLQISPYVGKPFSVMTSLVKAINEAHKEAPYTIEVEPIFDAETFWDFAEKNKGEITTLTFEFVAPNGIWGGADRVKAELRSAKEKTGAQKIINTFKSDEGLKTDDEAVAEAVEYAVSGSGAIRAKAKSGKRFSSATKPETATVPDDGEEKEPMIVRAARHIAAVLGRL